MDGVEGTDEIDIVGLRADRHSLPSVAEFQQGTLFSGAKQAGTSFTPEGVGVIISSSVGACHNFDSQSHRSDSPDSFVPHSKLTFRGTSESSNLRMRVDFSKDVVDTCALHDIVRAWQSGIGSKSLALLLGNRLSCEIKMSQKELSRMTWDPSGWMIISEAEFRTPSDLTNLASRLSALGLDEETVLRIVVAYENDDHGLVDCGLIITPSLALYQPLILWTPEGKSWAHPSISSCGDDFRRGTSLSAILDMVEFKHVVCLPRSTIGRYVNHGYAYLVHPIFTADVTSALEIVMVKMMKSFSEWSRLTSYPELADFDLRRSGRRILSHSDDESERVLDKSTLLVPSVCTRVNLRRRRRHIEPVVPPAVDSKCMKLDSDLVYMGST